MPLETSWMIKSRRSVNLLRKLLRDVDLFASLGWIARLMYHTLEVCSSTAWFCNHVVGRLRKTLIQCSYESSLRTMNPAPIERPNVETPSLPHCMKRAAANAPKSAKELPILMLAEEAPVADADESEEVWLPWKPALESVAVAVVVMAVVEAVNVAMLMVVFLGRAVPVPALMLPIVPTVPIGAMAVVLMVVLGRC